MSMENDIKELREAGIIDNETAEKIHAYYQSKKSTQPNRLFIVFAILGALMVGLGIILIIAHNWDGMPRMTKTILSFAPLIVGQAACGYTLWKKMDSISWREGSATFLFFAVGASISLISQVYNIPGNMTAFIISWMLLCLPLVYLLKSSAVSLLYIIGITSYAVATGYVRNAEWPSYYYWLMLLLILPHYYYLYQKKSESNFLNIHHLFVPVSLMFAFPILSRGEDPLLLTTYMSFFGCLYLIGHSILYRPQGRTINVFIALGSIATICLLLGCSFNDVWREVREFDDFSLVTLGTTLLFSLIAGYLLVKKLKGNTIKDIKPIAPVFIIFLLIILLGFVAPYSVVLINLLVLFIGVLTIREGALKDHLVILNYGLLIITALVAFRFFDGDMPFAFRGVMFLVVGIGFFLTNNWMLKRRKEIENQEP